VRAWALHDPAAKLVTQAPKSRDCDMIARRCAAADEGTALVFNCQMGRGRTTTAMIIAALVRCRLHPQQQPRCTLTMQTSCSEDERLMLQGDYAVVRSLVRVVEGGKEAKADADKVRCAALRALLCWRAHRTMQIIDCCSHMQNLREAILGYRRALGQEVRVDLRRSAGPVLTAQHCTARLTRSVEMRRFYAAWSTWSDTTRSSRLPRMCITPLLTVPPSTLRMARFKPGWTSAPSCIASFGGCCGVTPWAR
jgi:hypothetical protein